MNLKVTSKEVELTDGMKDILTLKLDFLNKDRSYQMTSFEDGINAGRQAMDYRCKSSQVKAGEQLTIKMVRNGGFAAVIE